MLSFLPTITLLHIFPLKPILFLVCRNRQPLHTANHGGTLRRFEFLGQPVEIELEEGSSVGVVQASKSLVQAGKDSTRNRHTDSSGGNKQVGGFSHTCVENGKHLQSYNCVAFFTHVCLFPYICVKIQTCVENSTQV